MIAYEKYLDRLFLDPDTQLAITVSKTTREGEVGFVYGGRVDALSRD